MPLLTVQDYGAVWNQLHAWLRREQWRGYDPYDGLLSPVASWMPWKPWRQAWIQFHKHSPVNWRPLLGIPKHQNPKTLALGISALCLRHRALARAELLREAESLAAQLLALRSPGSSHLAWGYPFDWQSRAFFAPAGTPNMVCTVFGGMALLDLYEAGGKASHLQSACECAEFVLQDLRRTQRGDSFCFSYTPLDLSCVHNVNFLGASLLARAGRASGRSEWLALARAAVAFSLAAQRADGTWPYGEAPNQQWVDGFHTGYNLVALRRYADCTGDRGTQENLTRGWESYRTHFFLEDGTPRYYKDRTYPLDIHNAAQGIITFLEVGRDRDGAERIARWTMENLWDAGGWFCFQKTRLWTVRIPYARWAEAWMLLALARLLLEGK